MTGDLGTISWGSPLRVGIPTKGSKKIGAPLENCFFFLLVNDSDPSSEETSERPACRNSRSSASLRLRIACYDVHYVHGSLSRVPAPDVNSCWAPSGGRCQKGHDPIRSPWARLGAKIARSGRAGGVPGGRVLDGSHGSTLRQTTLIQLSLHSLAEWMTQKRSKLYIYH